MSSAATSGVAQELHAIVIGGAQPVAEILLRHPLAPADLEPLIEIDLVDREKDIGDGEHAEEQQFVDEGIPIAFLQRVVETNVPLIEQHVDADERQFDDNHGNQQSEAGTSVFGAKIGYGESPDGGERRGKTFHGQSPIGCVPDNRGIGRVAVEREATAPRNVTKNRPDRGPNAVPPSCEVQPSRYSCRRQPGE
jgi:hypothetical protein